MTDRQTNSRMFDIVEYSTGGRRVMQCGRLEVVLDYRLTGATASSAAVSSNNSANNPAASH